jgi:type I restriction enzyme R subunit
MLHKLIIAQRRTGRDKESKKEKDLQQCSVLAEAVRTEEIQQIITEYRLSKETRKSMLESCVAIGYTLPPLGSTYDCGTTSLPPDHNTGVAMSNFTFLSTDWPDLYDTAREAEQNVNSAPRTSCFYARRSLERAVKWLYANDSYLKQPYADNLAALIHEPTFRENLEPCLFPKILTIQKIGNLAVHSDKPISNSDSLHTLKELFHVLYWLARSYSPSATAIGKPTFDITRIPQKDSAVADRNAEQLAKLQAEQAEKDARLAAREAELARTIEEIAALKAKIQEYKQRNSQTPDDHDYSEAETRDYFIDLLLKESGWDLKAPEVLEYPVIGMPNDRGEGFVDYVLLLDPLVKTIIC